MDTRVFGELISAYGQQVLQEAVRLQPREVEFLQHFTILSRAHPPELARAALETAILRQEALAKFPYGERLYFTRPALEQASNYEVSAHRARRFAVFERVMDLGCSIGSDTLCLSETVPATIGVDRDALRLSMAQANLHAMERDARVAFLQADLTHRLPLAPQPGTALFFDPGRRRAERRVYSVQEYQPPLSVIREWLAVFAALGVKISPGVRLGELRDYEAEVEFISLRGELKEAVLWFGPLKTASRRATILPGPHTLSGLPDPAGPADGLAQASEPGAYLYEPDPAILRAGLVRTLGQMLGAAQLDPDIAYLTGDHPVDTLLARRWRVESWMPFGLKNLRATLRQKGISQVVVKKRGSPLQPEQLIQALRLKAAKDGPAVERVLFLTHLSGQPIVVICFP
ncbi:MAG: class I SAM-dependent methyltransferase [Chloroflexota bacterium]